MMERIRKEMILMERGLHSPVAGKRLSNLSDSAGNAVLEALENPQHAGRLSPRITSASLHGSLGDIPTKGKFEIDSLFGAHHGDNTSSTEVSSSESRKKINLYPEVSPDSDMNSDVEVGCPSHRSPGSISQQKENNSKDFFDKNTGPCSCLSCHSSQAASALGSRSTSSDFTCTATGQRSESGFLPYSAAVLSKTAVPSPDQREESALNR
ncbi:homeobox even-skipped homolog protein 2-like [Sinocyclocheilus rhinocerous]|uniref:homeobox even-skipped homolog protein 2-like n=1 Tax=Sinocyclocheilus rhinocerous TaxID=307959 RepID=UPI0007B79C86|nr:PREDICTED: homeobox even-skipped homolog protein 2-like [Sinocyclocheilus rhinocerous]